MHESSKSTVTRTVGPAQGWRVGGLCVMLAVGVGGCWALMHDRSIDIAPSTKAAPGMVSTGRFRPDTRIEVPPADWDLAGRVNAAKTRAARKSLLDELLFPNSPEHRPGDGVERLFKVWFATDPVGALDAVSLIGTPEKPEYVIQRNALKCGVEAFADNPALIEAKAMECLGSNPWAEDFLHSFRVELFPAVGKVNPQAGVRLLDATETKYKDYLFKLLCSTWVKNDPLGAVKEMATFGGNPTSNQIADWACTLSEAKLTVADALLARAGNLPLCIVEKMTTETTISTIRESGVEEYLAQLGNAADLDGIAGPALGAAAVADPGGFVGNMEEFEKIGLFDRDRDAGEVVRKIYFADKQAALWFFEALASSPAAQAKAAEPLSAAMLTIDANACAGWINSLPAGPVRDAALGPMLAYLESHHETETLRKFEELVSGAE